MVSILMGLYLDMGKVLSILGSRMQLFLNCYLNLKLDF